MLRGILTVVLIVALCVGCWMIYKRINGDTSFGTGEVYTRNTSGGSAEQARMETGAVVVDNQPLTEAHPTPSRSDAPGTINTVPEGQYNRDVPDNVNVAAEAAKQGQTPDTYRYPERYGNQTGPVYGGPSAQVYGPQPLPTHGPQVPAPAYGGTTTDTIPANPPNGQAYSGTGAYELYRQGDLTFRMDTKTGTSCIIYATLEQWRNPLVYSHSCGRGRRWRRGGRRREVSEASPY